MRPHQVLLFGALPVAEAWPGFRQYRQILHTAGSSSGQMMTTPRAALWATGGAVVHDTSDRPREEEHTQVHVSAGELEPSPNGTTTLLEYGSLSALGSNKTLFEAFIVYQLGACSPNLITAKTVDVTCPMMKDQLQALWKEERLLVMTLELWYNVVLDNKFHSKLDGFTSRYTNYIKSREGNSKSELKSWLRMNLGSLHELQCDTSSTDIEATLVSLKSMLKWFKDNYPYYYSGCLVKGCNKSRDNSFLGYLMARRDEKIFGAGRTEFNLCTSCGSISRFPRYNDAIKVLFDSKRGRCGEYSVCILALLECLGYEARWVVDWADHVWAEVRINNRW